MKKKNYARFLLSFLGVILLVFFLMQIVEIWFGGNIAVLYPKGIIALKERNLLFYIQALMLLIVIPVFVLAFVFIWKYRADNDKANYQPNWSENYLLEIVWWGVPCLIVLAISTVTWVRTAELDPFRPLESNKKPLKIQVVALQWKWLFIYPEEKIASLNYFKFPEKTPVNFEITADAPMNSFWIPQLGGQIYAMPKMTTQLHLIADTVGDYYGSSANISGRGFAGMHFIANASSEEDFNQWVERIKVNSTPLTLDSYEQMALPSENVPPTSFRLQEEDLFNKILMKYMDPHA